MIYEHPLAYLLGLEGIALLRGFTGEQGRAFVEERIAEVRRLLDDESLAGAAVEVARVDTVEGYRIWSETYDDEDNAAFDFDEPMIAEIVEALPVGVALDAACGTGRTAAALAARGHRIVGVDSSPEMLDRARKRLPDGDFLLGDLHQLPVADGDVDLVVCTLALAHLPALGPVFAEFARVLRPGGHLVISDIHPDRVARGSVPPVRGPGGQPGRLPAHRHLVGDYLRAALPLDLQPRRCEEPRLPDAETPRPDATAPRETGPWEHWPWSLAAMIPEAARAANAGVPGTIIWHFQLASG
ncbi:class I SAM-dependent methyltransferase [Saccharopolyspora sp. NPDC050389]|uniref:class I SAM-dependent methyltransferase n=1 Tax=Saccharopolyspora sp. NPDC050389 TaxID=3155516 RepID=UPI0033ED3208